MLETEYYKGEEILYNEGTVSSPKYVPAYVNGIVMKTPHRGENVYILRLGFPKSLRQEKVYSDDDTKIKKIPVEPSKLEKILASLTSKMPRIFARKEAQVELAPAYD